MMEGKSINLKEVFDLLPQPVIVDNGKDFFGNRTFCELFKLNRVFTGNDFFAKVDTEYIRSLSGFICDPSNGSECRFRTSDKESKKSFAIAKKSSENSRGLSVYSLRDARSDELLAKALSMIRKQKKELEELKELRENGKIAARAATVPHDLNNIMYIIKGYIELALDDSEKASEICKTAAAETSNSELKKLFEEMSVCTKKFVESAGYVLASSQKAIGLINRISSPEAEVNAEEFLIDSFIREFAWPRIWPVDIKTEAGYSRVRINKLDLSRVIINLVKNGNEAMNCKGIVQVSTAETANHVVITVRDKGKGISEEIKRKIFQVGYSTKGSNGMGLPSCKTIIEDNGGFVLCTNSEEGGAVFRVMLPLVK